MKLGINTLGKQDTHGLNDANDPARGNGACGRSIESELHKGGGSMSPTTRSWLGVYR